MRNRQGSSAEFDTAMLPNRNQLVSGGKDCTVRTAAHPLETFTDPASTRSRQRYDWQTGSVSTVHSTILGNARDHMSRLKTPTITSVRTHPDPADMYGCHAGLGVPASPMTTSKSSIKKSKKMKGR
jgi:hypothetical protein